MPPTRFVVIDKDDLSTRFYLAEEQVNCFVFLFFRNLMQQKITAYPVKRLKIHFQDITMVNRSVWKRR